MIIQFKCTTNYSFQNDHTVESTSKTKPEHNHSHEREQPATECKCNKNMAWCTYSSIHNPCKAPLLPTHTHTNTHTALPQSGSGRGWRVGITIFLLPQQKCLLEIQVGVGTYEIKITKYILNPFTMTQLKCLHGKCLEKRQAIVRFKMVIFSWKMLQLKGIPLMC